MNHNLYLNSKSFDNAMMVLVIVIFAIGLFVYLLSVHLLADIPTSIPKVMIPILVLMHTCLAADICTEYFCFRRTCTIDRREIILKLFDSDRAEEEFNDHWEKTRKTRGIFSKNDHLLWLEALIAWLESTTKDKGQSTEISKTC